MRCGASGSGQDNDRKARTIPGLDQCGIICTRVPGVGPTWVVVVTELSGSVGMCPDIKVIADVGVGS